VRPILISFPRHSYKGFPNAFIAIHSPKEESLVFQILPHSSPFVVFLEINFFGPRGFLTSDGACSLEDLIFV